jgi:RNA polymerase-binding transcription factor DksA
MTTIDTRKAALEARRAELQARLERIDSDLDQPPTEDPVDQATEPEDEEVLEDLGMAASEEIRMITAALDRIRQGSYGTCVNCGEPIDAARLDAVPAAPLCRDCARAA